MNGSSAGIGGQGNRMKPGQAANVPSFRQDAGMTVS
jgi:hypothetical protein